MVAQSARIDGTWMPALLKVGCAEIRSSRHFGTRQSAGNAGTATKGIAAAGAARFGAQRE